MALTDPVPSQAIDVFKRNMEDSDRFVNQTSGTVTNRTGKTMRPLPVISDDIEQQITDLTADINAAKADLYPIVKFRFLVDTYEITNRNELGDTATGETYRYVGATLPFNVTPATNPVSNPDFVQVIQTDHNNLTNRNDVGAHDDIYTRKIDSISSLLTANTSTAIKYVVTSYHAGWAATNNGVPLGGGEFLWSDTTPKSSHDGGHVIDPDRPFPTNWNDDTQKGAWFTPAPTGSGCFVRANTKKRTVNYGQFGDNSVDDSRAINSALLNGGKVILSKPVNIAVRAHFLDIKSNTRLSIESGTTIRTPVEHPAASATRTLLVNYATNVIIDGNGATLIMDAASYTDEYAHGLQIYESEKVKVTDLDILDSKGDGIYVGGVAKASKRINIQRVLCDGQRRNGLSIVHAQHVYVCDSDFNNSLGLNPQFGVDIEPNPSDVTKNITLERCRATGNAQSGFGAIADCSDVTLRDCRTSSNGQSGFKVAALLSGTRRPSDIKLLECTSTGDNYNAYIDNADGVKLDTFKGYDSTAFGIQALGYTNLKVTGGGIYRAALRGVLCQDSSSEAYFGDQFTVKDCKDVGFYNTANNLTLDSCVFEGNANSASPVASANVYIFNGTGIRLVNNKVRKGANTYIPSDGILLRNTGTIDAYLQGNDCKTGGATNGINDGTLPVVINAGNINNDGSYSTTAS